MTNFVTCCKFVRKGIGKREQLVHAFTNEEFSRIVGNIYAQSWLKQEVVEVDADVRPDLRKFLETIARNISTAKIKFTPENPDDSAQIKTKKLPPDVEKSEVIVRSKTEKSLQSVLVVTDYMKPRSTKLLNGITSTGACISDTEVCQKETASKNVDYAINKEMTPATSDNSQSTTKSNLKVSDNCEGTDLPDQEKLAKLHEEPSECDDAMPANCGQQILSDQFEPEESSVPKEKKSKSKKRKKEHKKHKNRKRDRKDSSPKRDKSKSNSKSSNSVACKKEFKEEQTSAKCASNKPQNYDPLDPAPARSAFPLPVGMDEGEIVSDKSDTEQDLTVAADLSAFVETSPDQFASIVSSINKFYSTAVVENDQFLNVDVSNDLNSDDEDVEMNDHDNLLITGKVESEGDVCGLDVYLYNRDQEELFVHHDYFLPAFPLALEWLDYNSQAPTKKGSLVAVGTVKSEIEIWPVDVLGSIQPLFKLGAPRGLLKNNRIAETLSGHSGAVTCLSWNSIIRKGLASGSVDKTVAFWDLEKGDCLAMFNHHDQEVSSVAFHPIEPYLLATGGFDRKVALLDLSTQESSCFWNLSAKVEAIAWSAISVNQFYAAQSNGNIAVVDLRFTEQVLFEFKAHEKSVTAIVEDHFYPGCLVSVSEDSHLKLWNLTDYFPICVKDKNMKMGPLSCVDSCNKNPFVYAVGGQSAGVRVVDFSTKAMPQFVDNTDCEDY